MCLISLKSSVSPAAYREAQKPYLNLICIPETRVDSEFIYKFIINKFNSEQDFFAFHQSRHVEPTEKIRKHDHLLRVIIRNVYNFNKLKLNYIFTVIIWMIFLIFLQFIKHIRSRAFIAIELLIAATPGIGILSEFGKY